MKKKNNKHINKNEKKEILKVETHENLVKRLLTNDNIQLQDLKKKRSCYAASRTILEIHGPA